MHGRRHFPALSTSRLLKPILIHGKSPTPPSDQLRHLLLINLFTPGEVTEKEKYFHDSEHQKEMPTLARNKQIPIPSIPRRMKFSVFRQKMEGPKPSEIDIKVLITTPTLYSQAK